MAFHRSMTTEQLTVWLLARGLHPDDCSTLEGRSVFCTAHATQ